MPLLQMRVSLRRLQLICIRRRQPDVVAEQSLLSEFGDVLLLGSAAADAGTAHQDRICQMCGDLHTIALSSTFFYLPCLSFCRV